MSSSRRIDVSSKYHSLTDCVLHLLSSTCNENRASSIKLYLDFHKGCFQFICEGMVLSRSEMNYISHCNQLERNNLINVEEGAYVMTLSRMVVHSKKVVIVATKKKHRHAYEVVFKYGVRTGIGFIPAKYRVSTVIKMYGLINVPRRSGDIGSYEYFVLKNHTQALALIHCSIPINVTEKIYGEIIRWPGNFTGLGSSFSALVQSDANLILPAHAEFHDVRMKAFFALDLHSDRFYQYVYLNNNFVRWKYLYTLFNRMLGKILEINTTGYKNHLKFVLCIECPNEYYQVHHGFFMPEIRLKQLNPIVPCFNILFSNIEMMYNCKKWCQFDRRIVRGSDNLSSKQRLKESHYTLILILDYSWENDFETLMEPLNCLKMRMDLNVIKEIEYLYQTLLIVKNEFGSYRLTLYDEKSKISRSALLQFITFLLNVWIDNSARRNGLFNLLKETLSSVRSMSALEDIKVLFRSNDRSNRGIILELKRGQINANNLSLSYDTLKLSSTGSGRGENVQVLDSQCVNCFHLRQPTIGNSPQNFSTVGRNSYAPKGTSPMAAKIENIAVYSECKIGQCINTYDIIQKSNTVDRNIGLSKKLKIQKFDGDIRTIPKDLFVHMKVVGQFDTKFIICELKKLENPDETGFIMFDQHGIDERIRLEDLLNNPSDDGNLPKYFMNIWILLRLENEELALVLQFSNYFSKFGIDINSFSSGILIIQSIPEILHRLGGYWTRTASSYVNYVFDVLKAIVEEQLHSIKCTGSTTNVIPNFLLKQMCKTACSSAIKFGQDLSLMDCCHLVDKLSKCSVPFLCAHGRPTAFFVGGIALNDENPTPPNLEALKQSNIY